MGESDDIFRQKGMTAEKAGLWLLNVVLVAMLAWNFTRTEEATRKLDVVQAILQRVEEQIEKGTDDRYTGAHARRDWTAQERVNARYEERLDIIDGRLRNLENTQPNGYGGR